MISKSNAQAIDTIIFDLGAVLIDWNPRYLYQRIFKSSDAMEFFLKHICTSDWNECQDGGRTLKMGTALLLEEFPHYHLEINAFYDNWTEMIGGAINETVEFLSLLKDSRKYKLFALTNWSSETFPFAQNQFPFLSWFEDIVVSGVEGVKKPDPEIYHLALKRFKTEANNSLFIDDNLRNITAAQQLGFNTYHFKNPKHIKKDLTFLLTL